MSTAEFIELTRAAWPKDISPSSQAWFTDKLNEALAALKTEEEKKERLKELMKGATLDYGYANGWGETPALIKECREKKHKTRDKSLGNFNNIVWCDICNYKYKYDSS
jgi:23S rRNA C2498 (ribose-2'-O)-methylase RlmM